MAEHHAGALMLDGDVALMLVLAQELDKRGINLIPSGSVKQARMMMAQLRLTPEVLIINCRVPGVCAFANEMVSHNTSLQVVGIVSGIHQCSSCRHLLTYCYRDPEVRDVRWLHRMVSLIESRLSKKEGPFVVRIVRSPKR